MTEEIELKPCPFCGGKAFLDSEFSGVYCNCGAELTFLESDKEAAEKWNRRPIEDALEEENARLREALETICAIYEINGAEWRFDKRLYDVAKEALENGSESRD